VNRVTLVCDFGHIRHTVEIEAVLDSRIEAGLRKNVMFATCLVRPGALLADMTAAFALVCSVLSLRAIVMLGIHQPRG